MILLAIGISIITLIISGICFHKTDSAGVFVVIFFSALALVMSIVGGIMMMLDTCADVSRSKIVGNYPEANGYI